MSALPKFEAMETWPAEIDAAPGTEHVAMLVAALYVPDAHRLLPSSFEPMPGGFGNCSQAAAALWADLHRTGTDADVFVYEAGVYGHHAAVAVGDVLIDASGGALRSYPAGGIKPIVRAPLPEILGMTDLLPRDQESQDYVAALMTGTDAEARTLALRENGAQMVDCTQPCRVLVDTAAMQPATATLLTVTVPARAGKSFSIGISGDLLKSTDGTCLEARSETVRMQSVQDLAELLGEMQPGQMLLSGVASVQSAQVVAKAARSGSTLSRDAESFPHQSGMPGVLVIDTDSINGSGIDRDDVLSALFDAAPGMADVRCVQAGSSGAGIKGPDGRLLRGNTGLHTFYLVADQSDIARALGVLHDRLWLAGHGQTRVNADGSLSFKSAVDLAMRGSSQPIYCRSWLGPGLLQDRQIQVIEDDASTDFLDTRAALPDLNDEERIELARLHDEARALHADACAAARDRYLSEQASKLAKTTSIDIALARAAITAKLESCDLYGPDQIVLSNGAIVVVDDVLADPARFHGQSCRDPIEPTYGSETVAKLFTDQGKPILRSYAHAPEGRVFFLHSGSPPGFDLMSASDVVSRAAHARPIGAVPFVIPGQIEPRDWLYQKLMIRGFVSATFGAGARGKTILTLKDCLSMACGFNLDTREPFKRGPLTVWYLNVEDPLSEISRRLLALCSHFNVKQSDFDGRLFIDTDRDGRYLVVSQERSGTTVHSAVVDAVVAECRRIGADVLVADPLVHLHAASENDNTAMAKVVASLRRVAEEADVAVHVIHHVRKGGDGETTVEDGRGAGALKDACRSVRTLTPMTMDEADQFGIDPDEASLYGYSNPSAKPNLATPTHRREWFKLLSVSLHNATATADADEVGVPIAWRPPTLLDGLSLDQCQAAWRAVANAPDSDVRLNQQADGWVGRLLADELGLDVTKDKRRLRALIDGWIADGVFIRCSLHSPRHGRGIPSVRLGAAAS